MTMSCLLPRYPRCGPVANGILAKAGVGAALSGRPFEPVDHRADHPLHVPAGDVGVIGVNLQFGGDAAPLRCSMASIWKALQVCGLTRCSTSAIAMARSSVS